MSYCLNTLPIFPPQIVGLDIETTGLNRLGNEIRAIGISDGKSTWILTEHFERIVPLLEDKDTLKVIHNGNFDLTFLAFRLNCSPVSVWDSLLAERVLWNGYDLDHSLDDVLARRLGVLLDKGIRDSFIGYYGPLSDEQLKYLENDCIFLPRLYEEQRQDLYDKQLMRTIQLENATLLPVLDMTLTGVGFKADKWAETQLDIAKVLSDIEYRMRFEDLGPEFFIDVTRTHKGEEYIERRNCANIKWGSWQQLRPVLTKLIGKDPGSTAKATLEIYTEIPFVSDLLEWKKWSKLHSWRWEDFINPITGRIHPDWKQLAADTGRFGCADPNLQQVPKPDPRPDSPYPNLRKLFMPLPGHVIIACDYSQQEPRLLAGISDDPLMIEAANEIDIYSAFARTIWHKEVTKKDPERQLAKIAVLAVEYGVYPKRLASQMGISLSEAEDLRNRILAAYPTATAWGNSQLQQVVQYGYSKTLIGRKRYFPEIRNTPRDKLWKYATISRNNPVQGSGVDAIKLSMCKVHELLKSYDAHLMMSIHDEIVVSANPDQAPELFPKIVDAMETAASEICPKVRFVAEGKISDIWEH
jgi:DNA polymerase I-like protein with 3'-5' exonuclease and polymerase domains